MSSGDQHAPSFLVHINNTRISAEREAEIKEIAIIDRINASSSFRIIAADPENLWREKDEYYIGSKIKISLGYKDDMEELFSGDITALSCAYKRGEAVEITITGYNPLHRLKRFKRYQAFTEKKVKDIVTELADGAKLQADAENLSYEHPFTVQNEMSDFEYLLALAERYDCFFSVKDTTLSFKRLKKNSSENLTLEYGKTLLEFRPIVETSRIISEVEVHAWNPAKHEAITGKAKYGDIDSQGGKVVNDSLGGGKAAFTDAYALDQNGADQLAKDMLARNTREYVSGDAATYGNIKIRAGAIVKIEGVAKKYAGKYFIVAAQHRIIPMKGYKTSFSFVSSLGTPAQSEAGTESSRKESAQPPAAATAAPAENQKKNPQFSNLKWKLDGADVTKAHVRDVVTICADAKDMDNGTQVMLTLFGKNSSGTDDFIGSRTVLVENEKIEYDWTVEYADSPDAKEYTKPEYSFELLETLLDIKAKCDQSLQVVDRLEINALGLKGFKYTLTTPAGEKKDGTVGDDEKIEIEEVEPGTCLLTFILNEDE